MVMRACFHLSFWARDTMRAHMREGLTGTDGALPQATLTKMVNGDFALIEV